MHEGRGRESSVEKRQLHGHPRRNRKRVSEWRWAVRSIGRGLFDLAELEAEGRESHHNKRGILRQLMIT